MVVDEVGVQSKHRARQFVTKMWVSDRKGNFHLATCLCDNGSEVNLQSNSFLPDDCVFDSPLPVTLEGVSGHSLAGLATRLLYIHSFGKKAMWRKLSLRMTTSIVPT